MFGKSRIPLKLQAEMWRAAKRKAMAQLRLAEEDILDATRAEVPIDTGSMVSTVRLEWKPSGFDWVVGDLQGVAKYVDYQEIVDSRTNYIDGRVIPAIQFVLKRRSLPRLS